MIGLSIKNELVTFQQNELLANKQGIKLLTFRRGASSKVDTVLSFSGCLCIFSERLSLQLIFTRLLANFYSIKCEKD